MIKVIAFIVVVVLASFIHADSDCLRYCQKLPGLQKYKCMRGCGQTGARPIPSAAAEDQSTGANLSEQLWTRYRIALFNFIKKGGNANPNSVGLQMVTEELLAEWDQDIENLNHIANQAVKYGSTYQETARTLVGQYERFLFNLAPPMTSTSVFMATRELRKAAQEAAQKEEEAKGRCKTYYDMMVRFGQNPGLYSSYETRYCQNVQVAHYDHIDKASAYNMKKKQASGQYADVFDQGQIFSENAGQWQEVGTTLKTFLDRAQRGLGKKFSVQCNSKTDQKETRTWIYKKKSGFIFKKTTTTVKNEYRFQNEHFNMDLQADSFDIIRVAPKGDWIDYPFIKKYQAKTIWDNKSYNFFGKTGTMSVMPKAYYVMYNPKVVLHVSASDGRYFEQEKKSSFSFGPFNSAKGSKLEVKKISSNNYRVTFSVNSDKAHIVAVDNHVF